MLKEYDNVIKEQLELGIVEKVPSVDLAEQCHFLNHHCVVRENAATTRVRIVFNGSDKGGKYGVSLNDCLHVGPSLNPLLFDILLRFRESRVALTGDIEKAFPNVEVDEKVRDFLRFLWVDDIDEDNFKLEVYRFNRVVFGLNASPFLLNATIRHHVGKYAEDDLRFFERMRNGFYVDDLVTGSDTVEEALDIFQKAKVRMAEAWFHLRKWVTNDRTLREQMHAQEGEATIIASLEDESYAKTSLTTQCQRVDTQLHKVLGLSWDCDADTIHFKFENAIKKAVESKATKRNVLSTLASMFDPLGVFSPVSVSFSRSLHVQIGLGRAAQQPTQGKMGTVGRRARQGKRNCN